MLDEEPHLPHPDLLIRTDNRWLTCPDWIVLSDRSSTTTTSAPKIGKLASASGGSQANVSRNQDVYAERQAGQPAQDGGADQGAD
jgi:hypothetical protein